MPHIVLIVDGIVKYESDIGTLPIPAPTPTPVPIPVPTPVPTPAPTPSRTVPYHMFRGETRAGLEYKFKNGYAKMPEGWSWEEFEASGFMAEEEENTSAPVQDGVIRPSSTPYRVNLQSGQESRFTIPTTPGEDMWLTLLEVMGTPDSLQTDSYVTDERGRLLAGPSRIGRHGEHRFKAQGSVCYLSITPTVSGPLGIQRR